MNRLDDLRQTLDHHAADLDGSTLDHASRRTSLDGRIAVHRRRRTVVRGTVAGAAALALVGVVVLPLVDEATSERGVGPVDRTVLGEKAPAAIKAGDGWTYRFAEAVESDGRKVQVKLEGSRYPQLVTWSTAGEEQAVDVSGPGVAWASTRADFADHLVTPRGYDEKVTVSLPEGAEGVAVAVYEIDLTRPPAGVGDPGGIFFRDSSASHRQLGAAVAEPAATGITVPWNGAGDTVAVESVCTGAPEGTGVMVSLTGAEIPAGMSSADAAGEGYLETFGTCDDEEPGFDLGAAPTTSFDRTDPDQSLPASGTARMWLSVSEDDPTPLSEGEAGRAQFGLGVYTSTDADSTVLGFAQPLEIDRLGHRWTLHTVATMTPGEPLDVSPFTQDGPALVSFVQEIRKRGTVGFRIETTGARELDRAHMGISVAGEVQFGSELLLPGTTGLTLAFTEGGPDDVLAQRAVVYTLAD